jgi:hypothetical protein
MSTETHLRPAGDPVAEPLATGWDPDGDPRDTLVRRYLHASIAQADAFAGSLGGRTASGATWSLADVGRPSGFTNGVTLRAPLPYADPDAVLDEIEVAVAGGEGEVHLWSAWPTPDLRDRGWELTGHPPLLVRPPATVLPVPPGPDPATVEVVRDAPTLAEWEQVVVEGYPLPDLAPFAPGSVAGSTLLDDDRFRFTIGRHDGAAVSAGALLVDDGLGVFALAATRPAARGLGQWRGHAVDRLATAPDCWMAGVFSDFSRPLAEAIGFVPIQRLTLWTRARPRSR